MSPLLLTLMIFAIMLVLMAIRTPIAISMFVAGCVGYVAHGAHPIQHPVRPSLHRRQALNRRR